jgi:DNA-binding NtrC family response regulator
MTDSRKQTLHSTILVGAHSAEANDLQSALAEHVRTVRTAETVAAALQAIDLAPPELAFVLADVPPAEALGFVQHVAASGLPCGVVVLARPATMEAAVRFGRAGALHYAGVPLDRDALGRIIQAVDHQAPGGNGHARFFCEACPPGVPIVGHSEGIVQALRVIRRVAESRCNTILLTGETGTGKELAARAVHAWRGRQADRFVAVNCAALTANLLESELFGHVKGAFTGADRDKEGLLELAGDGTVLLDEISEMPLELQAKLLRVLQERTFRRVGGTRTVRCGATVIVTSNRDLLAEVEAGKFRKDLYYRLAVFPIWLPPLRSNQRRDDIPLLAAYFIEHSSLCPRSDVQGLAPTVEEMLLKHDWPGNVRELRNVIDRALILEPSQRITPQSVILGAQVAAPPIPAVQAAHPQNASPPAMDFSLEAAERLFILRALRETGWQRTRAAALLGITRATLHAKLKRYDIQPPDTGGKGEAAEPAPHEELEGAQA